MNISTISRPSFLTSRPSFLKSSFVWAVAFGVIAIMGSESSTAQTISINGSAYDSGSIYAAPNSFQSSFPATIGATAEPNWYPYVRARGEDRMIIQNTPMEQRPYRPFHFYGNAVRRTYYRGNPVPMPRDWVQGTVTGIRRW